MNKLVIASSALILSLSLVGCNTARDASQFGTQTVGTGVKYGVNTVGTGVGIVTNTGAAVGQGIGSVLSTGVGVVTSPLGYRNTTVYHKPVVYQNGHRYVWRNGNYVLVR